MKSFFLYCCGVIFITSWIGMIFFLHEGIKTSDERLIPIAKSAQLKHFLKDYEQNFEVSQKISQGSM